MRNNMYQLYRKLKIILKPTQIAIMLLGTAILSFGLYHIHRQVGITEGGVLGMVLLLDHTFCLPPWLMTIVLDLGCYMLGVRFLGKRFILLSIIATIGMSIFYRVWEVSPVVLPNLIDRPLLAAVLGGIFVGVGVGLVVYQGGSSGGDDALALVIAKVTKHRLAKAYLFTDLTVLLLSLSYIPFSRISYSLVTVTISSWIIDKIQNVGRTFCKEQ